MIGKVSRNPLTGCLYPETVSGATAGTVNMLDFTDDDTNKPLVLAGCVSDDGESFVGKTDNGTFNSCLGVLAVSGVDAKIKTTISEASTSYDISFISNSELKGGQTYGQVTLANVGDFTYNPATQTLSVCNICTNCIQGWNPFELKEICQVSDLYGIVTQPVVFCCPFYIDGRYYYAGSSGLFINCHAIINNPYGNFGTDVVTTVISYPNCVESRSICVGIATNSVSALCANVACCLKDCRAACSDQWVRQCCGVVLAHAIQFC